MMDRVLSEVNIDSRQYGGVKKCGVDNFFIQSWENILSGLEDNRGSVNLISIDFSKAFNQMSHQECVKAFHKKGASNQTLNLIAAFLSGRTMLVKINQNFSKRLPINGGSPQGCESANALFCTTIERLQEGQLEESNCAAEIAGYQDRAGESSLLPATQSSRM